MLSMDEEKYLTISDTSDLIDSGTDNFKNGQFHDVIIHEGRFVQIPGFKITSIFHILPYYPLCDARYAPGQSETDFSTISQSDYVLQQWRCNKWRSKYPSELVSYERTVWPITISTCPVYVGIHQKGLCFQHIWKIYLEINCLDIARLKRLKLVGCSLKFDFDEDNLILRSVYLRSSNIVVLSCSLRDRTDRLRCVDP